MDSEKEKKVEVQPANVPLKKVDESVDMPWYLKGQTEVMTEEQAQNEVLSWLNAKRLSMRKRHDRASQLEELSTAIQCGDVIYKPETHELIQKIRNPKGDLSELKYPYRSTVGEVNNMLKKHKVDPADGTGRLTAVGAFLTGRSMAEISGLDQDDFDIVGTISLFFM